MMRGVGYGVVDDVEYAPCGQSIVYLRMDSGESLHLRVENRCPHLRCLVDLKVEIDERALYYQNVAIARRVGYTRILFLMKEDRAHGPMAVQR